MFNLLDELDESAREVRVMEWQINEMNKALVLIAEGCDDPQGYAAETLEWLKEKDFIK